MPSEGFESVAAVKAKLAPWREIVLLTKKLLSWDKPFYPGVIAGATTFIFLILFCLDMSNLTLFPLLIALVLIADFGVPFVAPKIFDPSKWTGPQEQEFEKICECISKASSELSGVCSSICETKDKSPKLFLLAALTVLLSLSWVGSYLNGFFAAWALTLTVLMIPGLKKNGALDKIIQLALSKTKVH
ncbi:ADP-ribosylation factor-like protein 6-interacting protein 1 [Galendromus occidentalis]|uniref:ADP-ribosylation factor-like protein 6-interacting protein 1 n=1 Tax=Galendromus occidentalis TaxID=34638 RepID=A0AAJ6QSI5_9ACAR|nr:ADP-ribosylation factor-like protein 6-interacting protein 1 [Galendromus occidentalis]